MKKTFSCDEETFKKLEILARRLSSKTSYFGGRKNNQTATLKLAIEGLWVSEFGNKSMKDIIQTDYGKRLYKT